MNRLLRILIIGALLCLIAYNLFHSTCPPAGQIISHWEKNADEYHAGNISFNELILRPGGLSYGGIACIQTRRSLLRYCIETGRSLLPGRH